MGLRKDNNDTMIERQITIINKLGLHARAATKFANVAKAHSSSIEVVFGDKNIDGKSIMGLMLLAAARGSEIVLRVQGADQEQAMAALVELINNRFDEEE